MAYPVTLVESNPVTDIEFTSPFATAVGGGGTNIVGSSMKFGSDNATYGRQLTFVFLLGFINEDDGALSNISLRLQGYRESTGSWSIVPGKEVILTSTYDQKIVLMYINDHQLKQLGIDEDSAEGGFDFVRYWIYVDGTASAGEQAWAEGSVFVVAADLRYGLFGTNDQIASQMKNVGTGASAPVIIK